MGKFGQKPAIGCHLEFFAFAADVGQTFQPSLSPTFNRQRVRLTKLVPNGPVAGLGGFRDSERVLLVTAALPARGRGWCRWECIPTRLRCIGHRRDKWGVGNVKLQKSRKDPHPQRHQRFGDFRLGPRVLSQNGSFSNSYCRFQSPGHRGWLENIFERMFRASAPMTRVRG